MAILLSLSVLHPIIMHVPQVTIVIKAAVSVDK